MTHYICTGSCQGESNQPGICEAEFCSREGKELIKCECEDGSHIMNGEGDHSSESEG